MAVVRIEKTKDYTVMSNYHFREREMSLKAKGLLSFMLSLPDDWDYSIAGLETMLKESRSTIATTLKELEEFRYLKRNQVRENGKIIDWEYVIYEKPYPKKPDTENQDVVNQHVENPVMENCAQLNTNKKITKKQNTKKQKDMVTILESVPDDLAFALEDFIEARKKMKAPLTPRGLELIILKANKLSDGDLQKSIDIVNQSIERGWKGVFELQEDKKPVQNDGNGFSFKDLKFDEEGNLI